MKWIQLFLYVQSIRMQEFEMDEEETETMERNESSEIVNTQSLHSRVFLDCHDLYCIISQPFNSWQHLISEVSICVYLWFLCNKSSNILSLSSSTDDHNLLY